MRAVILAVAFVSSLLAAPAPEPWKLPRDEAEKYARRLKEFVRDGWKVTIQGNDLILQRDKPVRFAHVVPNAPPPAPGQEEKPDLHEGTYKLILRFGPRLSLDEYERQTLVNAETEREIDRLQGALNLRGKFGQFLATTPEEKARLKDYEQKVALLPRFELPDMYSTDHSITLFLPGDSFSYVYDKDAAAECHDVMENVTRYFGVYNFLAARGGTSVGRYGPRE
jgi:hypothetical protein